MVCLALLGPATATGQQRQAGPAGTRFSWPLAPPHPVVRAFHPPASRYGRGHRGVDIAAAADAPVLAAGDGRVIYAGPLADRSLVAIEHPDGIRTSYEPIAPSVHIGQHVVGGQLIGNLLPGHPGCPAGLVCLHWGAHRDQRYLNPLRLVGSGAVRLLPWRER